MVFRKRNIPDQELTREMVAQMVEAAEDTWVLYFFKSLFRVDSSKVQALGPGMFAVIDWGDDEGKDASSERLPVVISLRGPSAPARGNDAMANNPGSVTVLPIGWGTQWNANRSLKLE